MIKVVYDDSRRLPWVVKYGGRYPDHVWASYRSREAAVRAVRRLMAVVRFCT